MYLPFLWNQHGRLDFFLLFLLCGRGIVVLWRFRYRGRIPWRCLRASPGHDVQLWQPLSPDCGVRALSIIGPPFCPSAHFFLNAMTPFLLESTAVASDADADSVWYCLLLNWPRLSWPALGLGLLVFVVALVTRCCVVGIAFSVAMTTSVVGLCAVVVGIEVVFGGVLFVAVVEAGIVLNLPVTVLAIGCDVTVLVNFSVVVTSLLADFLAVVASLLADVLTVVTSLLVAFPVAECGVFAPSPVSIAVAPVAVANCHRQGMCRYRGCKLNCINDNNFFS